MFSTGTRGCGSGDRRGGPYSGFGSGRPKRARSSALDATTPALARAAASIASARATCGSGVPAVRQRGAGGSRIPSSAFNCALEVIFVIGFSFVSSASARKAGSCSGNSHAVESHRIAAPS